MLARNLVPRGIARFSIKGVSLNRINALPVRFHNSAKQMASTTAVNAARFLADRNPPLCSLSVKDSFAQLTENEKLYAHWVGTAAWAGARIVQEQWTPEAQSLYDFLISIFSTSDGHKITDLVDLKSKSGLDEEEWTLLLEYVAQSFGFTKFVPRLPEDKFAKVVEASPSSSKALPQWEKLKGHIYGVEPEASLLIGKRCDGHVSNYYPGTKVISNEEAEKIQKFAENISLDIENTRVLKESDTSFAILIASADERPDEKHPKAFDNVDIAIRYGDYSSALKKVVDALTEAKKYAAARYESQYTTEASTHWVKDVGPVVESYIGFIETYVDPYGGRAEWEGFTAIVNKALTAKFETMVKRAPELIKTLPWGKDFEVDVFRKPDFTGIPAGINIPTLALLSYYEVREQVGFKGIPTHLTDQNILAAKAANEIITFLSPEDVQFYKKWDTKAFDVQVANHELLGHGSGKLFTEDKDGKLNFDPEKTISPLTGKPVTTWYKPGQTAGSVLGVCSSSFEECRAECEKDCQDIEVCNYAQYLLMARAGVRALELYDPKAGKHLQAHMQARLGITNYFIQEGLAELVEFRDAEGKLEDVHIKASSPGNLKSQSRTHVPELQIRKSIADGEGAREFYEKLIGYHRDLVLAKKQPRKVFVQPNTFVVDGKVELKEYPLTNEGVLQSFIERRLRFELNTMVESVGPLTPERPGSRGCKSGMLSEYSGKLHKRVGDVYCSLRSARRALRPLGALQSYGDSRRGSGLTLEW
ncbi:dipeptidyl peptidase III [Rhizoctonia solani AG-1 IA]|uniref:Dipeptidyl peptidase III n=1 Tax=Thanatephorus cucumeris (strain AG1-IA) TaxID=983506 RepID=L8X8X4_THACA|nr:dipeptidyl peptidase III [Rhizoctonia solani AG-1 IA]